MALLDVDQRKTADIQNIAMLSYLHRTGDRINPRSVRSDQKGDRTILKITIFGSIEVEGTKEELLDMSIDIAREFMRVSLDRADEIDMKQEDEE